MPRIMPRTLSSRLSRASLPALAALLVSALLSALAAPALAAPSPRIIGGSDAANGEYPFVAALVNPANTYSDLSAQYCAGTVIAPRWVLTAGHCVTNKDENYSVYAPNEIAVIAGATTLDDSYPIETDLRTGVAAIIRHPAYGTRTLVNDLALLYLAESVSAPASLELADNAEPTHALPLLDTEDLLVAIGWGLTDGANDTSKSATLQDVALDYFTVATCDDANHYDDNLPANTICAGFLDNPARDTCYGDSGGPLLLPLGGGNWRQVGITSYGDEAGCATVDRPGVYTQVGAFHDFIVGAQTQPDLAVTAATRQTLGDNVMVRFTVTNLSPVNSASDVTLTTSRDGDGLVTIEATGGPLFCTSSGGDRVCELPGTLLPGNSTYVDVTISFPGTGLFRLNGTAAADNGDYYAGNDSGFRSYKVKAEDDDGGSLPPALLVLLALCAARRRR